MMVLIVDSGSTKTDWVLLNGGEHKGRFETMGFNPYFHDAITIAKTIQKQARLAAIAAEVEQVHYYGAGVSSDKSRAIVVQALTQVFTQSKITVEHDLLAAAYATYAGQAGIACIIGTGSNSCFFDGTELNEASPAAGYILGDEGSGSFFGKALLKAYLYRQLPAAMTVDFEKTYNLDKEAIFDRVYREAGANVFLASFMPFIAKHKAESWTHELLVAGFREFMRAHVACYSDFEHMKVHFIGSISAIFEAEIRQAAEVESIQVGSILRKPIEGLIAYHQTYLD